MSPQAELFLPRTNPLPRYFPFDFLLPDNDGGVYTTTSSLELIPPH